MTSKADSYPTSVLPSLTEVKTGRLSPQNLEIAIRSLYHDGLVVVEDLIEHNRLDTLNRQMVQDAYTLQTRQDQSPFNYNRGNIQQDAPPVKEYFDTSIFMNPIVTQITSAFLGPRPKWTFSSGNTALPPTSDCPPQNQPVHSDADFDHPNHPFALVVNVPLVTMEPRNGSTEIWLGTHANSGLHAQEGLHGERASGRIRSELLQSRLKERPPCQPVVKKGSVIVRDLRLWHAGRGNFTLAPRVMLAMIHFAPWYRNGMKLQLAKEMQGDIEEQQLLEVPVNWVEDKHARETYLDGGFGNSYDFSQLP